MYYSSIGILAILILFINNYNILVKQKTKDLNETHKAYKRFLVSIASFYVADILWSPLYQLNVKVLNFVETSMYFVFMAFSVFFWTKYVILYLNEKNTFAKILNFTGRFFLVVQIIVLTVNFFVPIAFWFEPDGSYHTSIARNINLGFQAVMFLMAFFYLLHVVFKTEGNIRRRHRAISLVSMISAVFVIIQGFDPYIPYYSIGCMLATCLLHTFVLEDEKEARREQLESLLKVEQIQELELGKTRTLAYSDPLTGVKNKMAYIEDVGCFEQRIEDGALHDFGLIVFDLNDLKKTNDTKGHDAGDQYIKAGCALICNKFKHSPVYRIGGDEFVAFLSGEDYKNHKAIIEDFHKTILKNLESGDVVIAHGFADYARLPSKDFMRLFETADKLMYECKQDLKARKLQISS